MYKKLFVSAFAVFLLVMAVLAVKQIDAGGMYSSIDSSSGDTLGVIDINGVISANSPSDFMRGNTAGAAGIMEAIRTAAEREDVKAVLIRINSPGGTTVASQEIAIELDKLREQGKPVIVSMGEVCASGGYWIAASSDHIMANAGTITGSIGVIMEFTNLEGLYEKIGVEPQVIKSREHKDIGSAARDMTDEERQILQEMVDDSYRQFLDQVRRGRGDKIVEEELYTIADGRVFSGQKALELGLVDSLGNYYDAVDFALQMGGMDKNSAIENLNSTDYWDWLLGNMDSIFMPGPEELTGYRLPMLKYIY